MADWQSFAVQIPGNQLVEPIATTLETLVIFLEILRSFLDIIKTFLVDFGNPIRALVQALIKLVEELFLALKVTGIFAYFDIPDPTTDPNFDRYSGGFEAFVQRFKSSIYDTKDFNRPQPRTSTVSGFILMVVEASDIMGLVRRVQTLMRFFGKEFTSPRYEAPANFRVIPVGTSGDPIFATAAIFSDGPINAIQLQWTLPSSQETPDPGFSDVVAKVATEFIPPNFVIERSTDVNPTSVRIDLSKLGDADSTGIVEYGQPTNVDASLASRFAPVQDGRVIARNTLRDKDGEPVIKFQKYFKVGVGLDVLGQLSRFRYIDKDVEPGKTYYYRVRSYSGKLALNDSTDRIDGMATTFDQLEPGISGNVKSRFFKYPSASDDPVVMGKPTGVIRTVVPADLAGFDVAGVLRQMFLTAFSLDFHLPLPEKTPSGTTPEFDGAGFPVMPTPASYVGRGSLTSQAGQLAAFESQVIIEHVQLDAPGQSFPTDSIQEEKMPWQFFNVRRNAFRIADGVASSILEAGGTEAATFRDFMRGPLPRGPISTQGALAGATTLEAIVIAFTKVTDYEDNTPSTFTTYVSAYDDAALRANLLVVIQFIKNFSLGGAPVDWISVSPLRDIVPWAGQFLYEILDKVQGLFDAYAGVLDEVKQFIDLIERRITALERFIEFLLEILDFIEGLELGAYLLVANNLTGDASSWVSTLDNAGGTKPTTGAAGYSAGIGLAYVTPDAASFLTAALGLIFGV